MSHESLSNMDAVTDLDPISGRIDLSMQSVLRHFMKASPSGQLLNFVLALDRQDRWAVDYNEMQGAMPVRVQELVLDLQTLLEENVAVMHRVPSELASVLSHLTTSRCVYVLRYLSQHNPTFLDQFFSLVEKSERNPSTTTIRRRFEAFVRASLLGEIFSGQRLERIARIMGSYTE